MLETLSSNTHVSNTFVPAEALMKRYIVVEKTEGLPLTDPFTIFTWPIKRLAVHGSKRLSRTIPGWSYAYEIREVQHLRGASRPTGRDGTDATAL